MKRMLTLYGLLLSFFSFAQHSPQDIKKHKITKVTKLSVTKGDETIHKTETLYDNNGNDTAEYVEGVLTRRTKYEYDSKGQALNRTRYDSEGNEIETAVYTYQNDGSILVSNTDKSFGMTDLTYIDKTGKTTRTISPDRTEKVYTYDGRGRLLKIKSKPGDNGGVATDQQYTYNSGGQLIRATGKGDYKWTETYKYDNRKLLISTKINSITDGVADPEVIRTYEYSFRK